MEETLTVKLLTDSLEVFGSSGRGVWGKRREKIFRDINGAIDDIV